MMLAAALVLVTNLQEGEDLVTLGLRYLARHQAKEGSWGLRLRGCECPAEPLHLSEPVDDATRARVAALLPGLDDDDFDRRVQAQKNLAAIGRAAAPQLEEASAKGSIETRWRSKAALREIGCAIPGDDVEVTGMALNAFLGAGHRHTSNTIHDGKRFGAVVEAGLQWLIDRQKADGSFGGTSAAANAWASLALSEALSMTDRALYRDHAQIAMNWIVAHPAADARGLLYQGMALKSAEIADLVVSKEAARRVTGALAAKRGDEPSSIFILSGIQLLKIFTERNKRTLDLSGIPGLHPSRMEMETVYVVGLALFQADGPGGPHWKAYNEDEKAWIVPLQQKEFIRCDRGSWGASGTRNRMKTAALATLSRELYYAYAFEK
jgi:hypothetical protein